MILYIECKMGAAGDMLMAALYELLEDGQKKEFIHTMNGLYPKDICVTPLPDTKCGILGTHMKVEVLGQEEEPHNHNHDHHDHVHYSYQMILTSIDALSLPEEVKQHAKEVYRRIGEAEAKVHGSTLEQIHFHEVGSMDAIADVIGNCLLLHMLAPEKVIVSPIHVGNGTVHCAHGILPVPAPATEAILTGVPYYTGDIMTELCTPTGAALLTHFADDFGPMPSMMIEKSGKGTGHKEFKIANMVRVFLGNLTDADANADQILEISCNIDDMTGEDLGYAMDKLLEEGALDVFYTPIQMKKNRPGTLLRAFCKPEEQDKFTRLFLKHTTSRGVRYQFYQRTKMTARFEEITSELGTVHLKINEGLGITKSKLEYDDLKKLADATGKSLAEIRSILESN